MINKKHFWFGVMCVSSLLCFGMALPGFVSDANNDSTSSNEGSAYTRAFEKDAFADVRDIANTLFHELFNVQCWYTNTENSVTIRFTPKRTCVDAVTQYNNKKKQFFEYFEEDVHSGGIQFVRIQFGEFVLKEEEIISRSYDSESYASELES